MIIYLLHRQKTPKDKKNIRQLSATFSQHSSKLCKFSSTKWIFRHLIAGSLESAYSLNWGDREIWGKSEGETLALLL